MHTATFRALRRRHAHQLAQNTHLQNILIDAAKCAHDFGGMSAAAGLADQAEKLMGVAGNGDRDPGVDPVREITA